MTWQLKIRTAPGALIAAEYECPVHGRFAADVPRDESGDPPATAPCSVQVVANVWPPGAPCRRFGFCDTPSPHVISAPGIARVRKVEAHRGKYQKPEFETWTNTENLGEGQDLDDWKADRAKVWEREREREAMELAREL
jgi:hypothetical protein